MIKSTESTCPLGDPCPVRDPDPTAAHPPPVKWLERLIYLFDQAIKDGLLANEEDADVIGLYLRPAGSVEYKILEDNPEGGVRMVSAG